MTTITNIVTNIVKHKALRMLCEEHLYKCGESDTIFFGGNEYKIMKIEGGFIIQRWLGNMYDKGKVFSSLGKLFNHFFITNGINIDK